MSEIEIITDGDRQRRWPAAEKLQIVEETLEDGARIAIVARGNGVVPNRPVSLASPDAGWGTVAVSEDDNAAGNRAVRQLGERIRELERHLGRKTLEAKILKEALDKSRSKKLIWHAQLRRSDCIR